MNSSDDEVEEMARLVGMDDDPLVKEVLNNPLLRRKGKWLDRVGRWLEAEVADKVTDYHPFLPGPRSEQAEAGDLDVGRVVTGTGPGHVFRMALLWLLLHVLICGSTGSGKTTLGLALTIALHRLGKPVWWLDSEDEVAPVVLGACGTGEGAPLLIDYEASFMQNIFRGPSNVDQRKYITRVTSLMRETDFMRDGSVNLLREICFRLLDENPYFSVGDVYRELQRMRWRFRGREAEYYITLRNRLGEMLASLGKVYDAPAGHDISKLLKRSVIWRLRSLSDDHLTRALYFLSLFVGMHQPVHYQPVLDCTFYIDEATRVCNVQRAARADLSEPFIYEMARAFRKRGIALIMCTQTPHLLPKAVLSNLCNWLVFRPTDSHYIALVANSLALDREQQACLARLGQDGTRRIIARTVTETTPFLVELPDISFSLASADEIEGHRRRTRAFLNTILEKVKGPVKRVPKASPDAAGGQRKDKDKAGDKKKPESHGLSKEEIDYIVNVADKPFLWASDREKRLGVSSGKGKKIRAHLESGGYITGHQVVTGKKGRPPVLTELTDRAYALLDSLRVKYERPRGHGSFVHKFWQHAICEWARRNGWPARIEDSRLGEKSVDVSVDQEARKTAYEVLVEGARKEIGNLVGDVETGWDEVVFCAADDDTLKNLKALLEEDYGRDMFLMERVKFMRLGRFLE